MPPGEGFAIGPPPVPVPRLRLIHVVLFFLTCLTTLISGYAWNLSFAAQADPRWAESLSDPIGNPFVIFSGASFAVAVLSILLAHEFGHYLTCRYYGIRATLPFVIPAPPFLNPFGTFGAVIRIQSLFRNRKQLFDVGIAGPLAGFVIILPAAAIGLALSSEFDLGRVEGGGYLEFGEPLLFQLAASVFFKGDTANINLHPIGWAAWFGMLATSLNLLPVGQLDGGHIVYALFGERGHRIASYLTFIGLIVLSVVSWPASGYLVFALFLLIMRFRHPRPFVDFPLKGRERWILGAAALVIFILTFIPVPVRVIDFPGF